MTNNTNNDSFSGWDDGVDDRVRDDNDGCSIQMLTVPEKLDDGRRNVKSCHGDWMITEMT